MVEGGSQVSKLELRTKYRTHFLTILHLELNACSSRLLCPIIIIIALLF